MNKLTIFMLWLVYWCYQIFKFRIHANQEVYLYSINRGEISENLHKANKTPTLDELELWHNQSYGDLVMSEIANEKEKVPIWKSIDEHLKDIDLYVAAMQNVFPELHSWNAPEVNSGTSGVLMLYNGTSMPDKRQLMYSWDTEHERVVPIPKFAFRFIRAHCFYDHEVTGRGYHDITHHAVIVIHNDPTTGSDDDRFDCQRCSGWDDIVNTYTEAGLTYVCQLSEEISQILGIDWYYQESLPLNLDSMEYTWSEHWEWTSLTSPRYSKDQSGLIYDEYLRLKYPRPSLRF